MSDEPGDGFMDLFVADQAVIYSYVRTSIFNYSDAEEVFQQVAMTMWRKRDSFDPERGTFRAWAIGIARNHIRNYVRQQVRERRVHVIAPDVLDRIEEGWKEFDDTWLERQAALKECFGKLDATDRQRLEYYYRGDAKPKEMASSEGISLRTFYRKVQKLRKILLVCIAKAMDTGGDMHGRT